MGVNFECSKSKLFVGRRGSVSEKRPLRLNGSEVECVSQYKYLGSIVSDSGILLENV